MKITTARLLNSPLQATRSAALSERSDRIGEESDYSDTNSPVPLEPLDMKDLFIYDDDNSEEYAGLAEDERTERIRHKFELVQSRMNERAGTSRNIGALRITVAGDSGIGKTSLIESFIMMDEVVRSEKQNSEDNDMLKETKLSTVPEDQLHVGEDPFNITLIDTPGYGANIDAMAIMKPIVDYHHLQFQKTTQVFKRDVSARILMRYLKTGSGAHSHIDVCLYGILHRVTAVDLEYMKRLSMLCNVVPVILKCDSLGQEELFRLKAKILKDLLAARIPIYGFGMTTHELLELANAQIGGAVPFAFSSSEIITKPRPGSGESEFEKLKRSILYTHIEDLRALTAEKFILWRQASQAVSSPRRT